MGNTLSLETMGYGEIVFNFDHIIMFKRSGDSTAIILTNGDTIYTSLDYDQIEDQIEKQIRNR